MKAAYYFTAYVLIWLFSLVIIGFCARVMYGALRWGWNIL